MSIVMYMQDNNSVCKTKYEFYPRRPLIPVCVCMCVYIHICVCLFMGTYVCRCSCLRVCVCVCAHHPCAAQQAWGSWRPWRCSWCSSPHMCSCPHLTPPPWRCTDSLCAGTRSVGCPAEGTGAARWTPTNTWSLWKHTHTTTEEQQSVMIGDF